MALFSRARIELPTSPDKWRVALEAAFKVSEIASSSAALPDAIQAMVRVATDLLGAEQSSIMLLESGGRELVLVASSGLPGEVSPGYRLQVGESVAGRVIATGRPLRLGAVDRDAFVNFVPKDREITSSVVVPLRVQGRSIGVLSLASASAEFTEEDLRVAQMFADQAAGLIYRADMHEKAEQRSSDLMALVESSRGLVGTVHFDPLLERVLDGGVRLMGTKDGFVCLFDSETEGISRGVFRGLDKTRIAQILADPAVAVAIERVELATVRRETGETLVAAGLRTTRGTKGALVFFADPQLVEDRLDILTAFSQQCATALGAAELYAEVERKESELSSIIQGVANPIVLVDVHKRVRAVNAAAEQVFGITSNFMAGAEAKGALNHPEIERMLTAEGEIRAEVEAGYPARTYKLRVSDVRIPGTPIGRVLIMDDISSEREIVQMQRDFVAMIGHELRTPLTIIKGFARTLLRRVETATVQETTDALATIDNKAARLERLIEDLLYVSKIEAREASLRIEQVDIVALVKDVAEDVIKDHRDRELILDIPRKLEWPCDETKLALASRHLMDNALKYSEAPHPVTIRVTQEDDDLRIDVIDEGMGIISSDIPHIFDRFRQVDASSTREHGGTGVGLYLSAQLVRAHHGRIWVESTWRKGSTFSFSIPSSTTRSDVIRIAMQPDADAESA